MKININISCLDQSLLGNTCTTSTQQATVLSTIVVPGLLTGQNKKRPEVGLAQRHLVSRQTSVAISQTQLNSQYLQLEKLIEEEREAQEKLAGFVLPHHPSSTTTCVDNQHLNTHANALRLLVSDLELVVEQLSLENKSLVSVQKTLEAEMRGLRETQEQTEGVANELRTRCLRFERKLNEKKLEVQALEGKLTKVMHEKAAMNHHSDEVEG